MGCKQNKSQGWEKESAVHVSSRINPPSPYLARHFYIHFYSVEFYLSFILQSIGRRGLDPGIGRDSSFRAVVRLFGREHGRGGAKRFRINESKFLRGSSDFVSGKAAAEASRSTSNFPGPSFPRRVAPSFLSLVPEESNLRGRRCTPERGCARTHTHERKD